MGSWAPPELVAKALAGDRTATEELVAAIWPKCFRLAATCIGDRDLAQDAAQEACAIVHCKIRNLRCTQAFDAWLYRIVMREAVRVRRRRNAPAHPTYEGYVDNDTSASVDVWRALSALSPELRDAAVLFYFDDLKGDEIASILRVSPATVRSRLSRARDRLRTLLDDYADVPQPSHEETQHAF